MRLKNEELRIPEGYWYLATPYTKWTLGRDDAAQEAAIIAGA